MFKKLNGLALSFIVFLSVGVPAFAGEQISSRGIVREKSGFHTPGHTDDHELEFVRQSDGEVFDIENSEALAKVHATEDRTLLVEVEGDISSRFLFWGGNLEVKKFQVLEKLEKTPHRELRATANFERNHFRKSDI